MRTRLALITLLTLPLLAGCKRAPDPVLRHMHKVKSWTDEFAKRYPVALGRQKKPPLLGQTGEVGPSGRLSFILHGLPKDDLVPMLQWLSGKMTAGGVSTVTLDCLFPFTGSLLDEKLARLDWPAERIPELRKKMENSAEVIASRIVLKADGTWRETGAVNPPAPSFMGEPIR